MEVGDLLSAVLPVGVVAVHVGRHRPRSVEGDQGGDVVEGGGGERAHEGAHGAALELEHAHRVALAQHGEGIGVVERDPVDVRPAAGRRLDQIEGPLDHREIAEPEEVHLEQTEVLDPVHLVLGDDGGLVGIAAVGLALDGQVLGQGLVGDDHGGGVDAVLPPQAFEALGHVDDPLGLGVGLVHGPQLAGGGESVLVTVGSGQAGRQRRVATHEQRGHRLGDLVAHDVRVAEHPCRVAYRGPGLDGREGHDLGHVVGAVAVGGVLDHLAPVALVEVHVDVGHLDPARVEEPFEQEVVADGVEVDDLEAVGHTAAGRRTATRAHPDPTGAGEADQVPHHEEVGGEAHVGDDSQLIVEPGHHRRRDRVAVALLGPLHAQVAQVVGGPFLVGGPGELVGHREAGQAGPAEVDLHRGPFGDQQCVVARLRELGEEMAHLGGRFEVVLLALELEALGIVDERTGLDAEQRVVGHVVLAVGVVAVVGGEQRRPDPAGDLDQGRVGLVLLGQAVILELDEEVALPEDVLEPGGQGLGLDAVVGQQRLEHDPSEAPGGGDESGGVLLEELPVEPGLVVVALEVGGGRQLEQVLVALGGLGQQGEVVVELLPTGHVATGVVDLALAHRALVPRFGRHVGLGADDRVDPRLLAGGIEVEDSVHVAVIGDPEGRLAVGHRRLTRSFTRAAPSSIENSVWVCRCVNDRVATNGRYLPRHCPSGDPEFSTGCGRVTAV